MAAAALTESKMFCSRQFGQPSKRPDELLVWAFGNVVVDQRSAFDQYGVDIQATSGELVSSATLIGGVHSAAAHWDSLHRPPPNASQFGRRVVRALVNGAIGWTAWVSLSWLFGGLDIALDPLVRMTTCAPAGERGALSSRTGFDPTLIDLRDRGRLFS